MKIFLKLKYDGSAYGGYQVQKNCSTIQKMLNDAAHSLFGYECDVTGCSRTDAGVHAECFCATVSKKGESGLVTSIPVEKLPLAMNVRLPDDIAVFFAEWVDDSFHARYGVKEKTYIYKIHNSPARDPFLRNRAWHVPKRFSDEAVAAADAAARMFCGKHDFSSYMASGSKVADTVREVKSAFVARSGDIITFTVTADGFLYNMVRIMCGTLVEVMEGARNAEDIPLITAAADRRAAGRTAPACGLYLHDVKY